MRFDPTITPAMSEPKKKVFRVGLTGGIASGKTLVANWFAELDVPVIDTDEIARQVVAPGQPGLDEIVTEFGADVLTPDGRLDRDRLRRLVFADDDRRRRLEAILHPLIRERTLEAAASAGGPYQVIVVPLLVETGFQRHVDRVLVVDCPESMQRQRLLERDKEDREQVERMLAAQTSRESRLTAADDVLDNSGTPDQAREQVAALHQKYMKLARM
jgi:dephospho-CoA kinase